MQEFTTERTEEYWQNLRLSNDFLFGYAMQNTELARILLESLLGIEIASVEHIKTQDVVELSPLLHGVRLDVRLKADGRVVIIEMQTSNGDDLPRRIRYYQSQSDSQLLQKNTAYGTLPEFLTIFICTFNPFKEDAETTEDGKDRSGHPVYTITYTINECPNLKYDDGRRIIIFNTKAWKKSLAQNQKDMLKYIQDGGANFKSPQVTGFAEQVECLKTENNFRRNHMWLDLKIQEETGKAKREQRAIDQAEIDRLKALLAKEQAERVAEANQLKALLAAHNIIMPA